MKDYVLDSVMGFVVGDAFGVPVEFETREKLKNSPVIDMREYGTYNQPKGTWSDDSTMVLATMESICERRNIDYKDMMEKFTNWFLHGEYTPYGELFDIGNATSRAIIKYGKGYQPLDCGDASFYSNGNGSLMRILPVALYFNKSKNNFEALKIVHEVSCLTHANPISHIACGIYYFIVKNVIKYKELNSISEILEKSIKEAFDEYEQNNLYGKIFVEGLQAYERLKNFEKFKNLSESEIKSTGYVVDSLEAAIWCVSSANSYAECIKKAVNLGNDTDTIAAIAGGIAGCYYGYSEIPKQWIECIAKREWIQNLCERFEKFS